MPTFVQAASKKSSNIAEFLKQAGSSNSLKYSAEKNKKHVIYIPYKTTDKVVDGGETTQVKEIVSMYAKVHEWTDPAGRFRASVCLEGVVRDADDGTMINDGSCPICGRIEDGWGIYNARMAREQDTCGKEGADLKQYMDDCKGDYSQERKAKEPRDLIYILIAKFTTKEDGTIIMNKDTQLPAYEMKVMKLSSNRAENIQKSIINSGLEFEGCEICFDYPDTDDQRHLTTDCATAPVLRNAITEKYPKVVELIQEDALKFDWEGIEKAFPEWKGMSNTEAIGMMNAMFKQYDEYKAELLTNPNAKYLEYSSTHGSANPPLSPAAIGSGAAPKLDANAAFGAKSASNTPSMDQI